MRNLLPVVFVSHRAPPPPSLHGASGAVQSSSGSTDTNAICLPQRAQRRFADCCGPKNANYTSYFRLYFTLPTSRFLLRIVCLAQRTQRARRRFIDCCAPKNACPCATHFLLPTSDFRLPTSDFRLPTSDFRLPTFYFLLSTPVSTNDKIALEDIFFIMSVCQ